MAAEEGEACAIAEGGGVGGVAPQDGRGAAWEAGEGEGGADLVLGQGGEVGGVAQDGQDAAGKGGMDVVLGQGGDRSPPNGGCSRSTSSTLAQEEEAEWMGHTHAHTQWGDGNSTVAKGAGEWERGKFVDGVEVPYELVPPHFEALGEELVRALSSASAVALA